MSSMPSIGATSAKLLFMSLLSHIVLKSLAASGGSAGGSSGGGGGGGSVDLSGFFDGGDKEALAIVMIVFAAVVTLASIVACLAGKNIIIVQVALSGEAQLLLRDINQIARTTSTDSMWGCRQILIESIHALLRNSQYFISAYLRVERKWTEETVMDKFKDFSKQEHEKFDIESLVNFNNNTIIQKAIPTAYQLPTEYIVVTFLLATNRAHKIPQIQCTKSMEEALKHLIGIETHELLAVEVLWTPQNEYDNLTEQEFIAKYPCLKP